MKGLSILYRARFSLNGPILVRNVKKNLQIVIQITDGQACPCYSLNMTDEQLDEYIQACIDSNQCDIRTHGTFCGYPLDKEGQCEVHQ